jgi:hypothetical protein
MDFLYPVLHRGVPKLILILLEIYMVFKCWQEPVIHIVISHIVFRNFSRETLELVHYLESQTKHYTLFRCY